MDVVTAERLIGGRYRVEAQLGRGGTATVWRAHDLRLDRPVAIKELTGQWLDEPTALDRFNREARAVARLAHANVVAIHDVDLRCATPYLVMELIEGVTVARMLTQDGVLTVAQAVSIAAQVCDGLYAAHAAGVIHRDVKPGNLILTPSGVVKICDFGIARARCAGDTSLTGPQFVLGTTSYMAPEQVLGQDVDARADLYGLGCTLYAMLAGVPPFFGAGSDVFQRNFDEQPVGLRKHRGDVPLPLAALVTQLLAKSAADRPNDAAEVKARLADLMEPVARPTLPTLISPARVRRMWQIGAAAVCALIAIGTWMVVTSAAAPGGTPAANPASTVVRDVDTSGSESRTVGRSTGAVGDGSSVGPAVNLAPSSPPTDPVAALRLAVQEQVRTGNLNPEKASDLYKQVDLIAKAVSAGNSDEVTKSIKAMQDKLKAFRGGGQLSASGYDTLAGDLDAIAASV